MPPQTELIVVLERLSTELAALDEYTIDDVECEENDDQHVLRKDISSYYKTIPSKKVIVSDFDWIYKEQKYDLSEIIKAAIENNFDANQEVCEEGTEENEEGEVVGEDGGVCRRSGGVI